jgi:hypothetical protein
MFHAHSQPLSAPTRSRQLPAHLLTSVVDRATAQALRRSTTPAGVRDKRGGGRCLPAPSLLCAPTIRTLPAPPEAASTPVPVVIVPGQALALMAPSERPERRLRLDLSWMAALFVALSVTLALAIPLELFRQNG